MYKFHLLASSHRGAAAWSAASPRPEVCQSFLLLLGRPFPLLGQGSCSRAIELDLLKMEEQKKQLEVAPPGRPNTCVDGRPGPGHGQGWKWDEPAVAGGKQTPDQMHNRSSNFGPLPLESLMTFVPVLLLETLRWQWPHLAVVVHTALGGPCGAGRSDTLL